MTSAKYAKYQQDAQKWGLPSDTIQLEMQADELLKSHHTKAEKEFPCRTTEAEVALQRRRPETVAYVDLTPSEPQLDSDPDTEARQALSKLGTLREQQIWHLFMTRRTSREIADELGVSEAAVSKTIRNCRGKIRQFHNTYSSWQECRRYSPPASRSYKYLDESVEEFRRIIEEQGNVDTAILPQDLGQPVHVRIIKSHQRPGDDGVLRLTLPQLQTLAEQGEVKTKHGLISLENLREEG
jgi:RNA polymerase sigma factor (sigma-70 family)